MENGAEKLLKQVLATGDDSATLALLDAFHQGYPVHHLRRLLLSEQVAAVKAGVWIASELGARAAPLLDTLPPLLAHPSMRVRFFALDCVLAAATGEHGETVAKAVMRVEDAEAAVRWKALNFLRRATVSQLTASLSFLGRDDLAAQVTWMLGLEGQPAHEELVGGVKDGDFLRCRFALAAAARLSRMDIEALEVASLSDDAEIRSFAREVLEEAAAAIPRR
jgi:hypothetical protein